MDKEAFRASPRRFIRRLNYAQNLASATDILREARQVLKGDSDALSMVQQHYDEIKKKLSKAELVKSILKLSSVVERAGISTQDPVAFKISKVLDEAAIGIVAVAGDEDDMLKKLQDELRAFQEKKDEDVAEIKQQFDEEPKHITLDRIYIRPEDEPIADAEMIYLKDDPDDGWRYPIFSGKNKLEELKRSGEFRDNEPLPEELYKIIPVPKKSFTGYVPESITRRKDREQGIRPSKKRRKRF